MATQRRQTTPEGDAIIREAEAEAASAAPDPPPKDVPFDPPASEEDKPKRGRPPGTPNRRGRASKLDEIEKAAGEAIQRGSLLASYVLSVSPMPPERKAVWIEDTIIVSSEDGTKALTGSLRFACERNPRLQAFCLRAIEASAYTGIGATVLFGLILPICVNHGVLKVPAGLAGMVPQPSQPTYPGEDGE